MVDKRNLEKEELQTSMAHSLDHISGHIAYSLTPNYSLNFISIKKILMSFCGYGWIMLY